MGPLKFRTIEEKEKIYKMVEEVSFYSIKKSPDGQQPDQLMMDPLILVDEIKPLAKKALSINTGIMAALSGYLIWKFVSTLKKEQWKTYRALSRNCFHWRNDLLKKAEKLLNDGDIQKLQKLFLNQPINTIPLLSSKKFMLIANIAESEIEDDAYKNNPHYQALIKTFGTDKVVPVCAKIEYELSQLNDSDAAEMMEMFGLKEKSLDVIIKQTYENLGLLTFFTCGPKEAHAWPLLKGKTVRQAAGEIHSDIERGFICAEVFNYTDIAEHKTEARMKELGKIRRECQDYLVHDGDVIHIRFNV